MPLTICRTTIHPRIRGVVLKQTSFANRRPRPRRTFLQWCVALLLSSLFAFPASALDPDKPFRDYVTDSWGVEQGLPQISVLAITQDPAGYLWFGTQAGLARFDGLHFQRYTRNDISELGNDILALQADGPQRLWVATAAGLLLFEDGHFQAIPVAAGAHPTRRSFPVNALAHASDGRVLASGPDGIYVVVDKQLQRLHSLPGPALSLLPDADGLWVGSNGKVFHLARGRIEAYPMPGSARDTTVTSLAKVDDTLWAGTRHGLFRLQGRTWMVAGTLPGETPQAVEAMAGDHDGNLWVATPRYLQRLHEGHPAERIQNTVGSIAIRSIHEDDTGNLWLGSMIEGVTRVWNGWTRRLGQAEGLDAPLLWSIAAGPDGSIWAGSNNGVYQWQDGHFLRRVTGDQLPQPEAYSLLPEAGQTWIGTRAGVALLRQGRVEQPALLAPLHNAQINGIVRDRRGRHWFATTQGLYLLDAGQRLTRYGTRDGLADPRIRLVLETRDGRLLVGTYAGLYEWQDGKLIAIGRDDGIGPEIAVTALLELDDGRWVLGNSTDESLRVFDGRHWHYLSHQRGLPTNVPFHLAEHDGDLWVAGMQGVYRLPLASIDRALADSTAPLAVQMVINSGSDQPGGQQDKCCNGSGNSRGLLRDGRLWLPTRDGALLLDVVTPRQPVSRKLRIEGLSVQGRWFHPSAGKFQLPLNARSPRIEFSLPTFEAMHTPQLRYRLRGHDDAWNELESPSTHSVTYNNLPPGNYTFEVADFATPDPTAGAASLQLEVPPRPHETLAFRLLAVLLLAGVLWLGQLGMQHRYKRQQAVLERLVQERTRDLQAANTRLEVISFTDPLTGLHNRRYLARQIPTDLAFYERDPDYCAGGDAVVFALLDVDHFKAINDTHGHAAGDRVLEQLGQLLDQLKRSGDYVARWGGEEFLLVLRPLPRGNLGQIGQRLCSRIAAHEFDLGNGQRHRITVSIGLIECPVLPNQPRLLGWEQLVTLADRALYRAKNGGRNGWVAYRPATDKPLPDDLTASSGNPWWLVENGLLEMFDGQTRCATT